MRRKADYSRGVEKIFCCAGVGSGLHAAATALNYFAYNFIKIHRTLRMSPAMAAGVTDRLWDDE
jgi:hypothetical protein